MDTQLDVQKRIINCLLKILPARYVTHPFQSDTRFDVDCDMDSLAFVEFLVALEEEFGLNLSEDSLRLRKIATVADMVVFIEHLTSTNAR